MGLFDSLRNLFGKSKPAAQRPAPSVMAEQEEEIVVPEISPAQLKAQMQGDSCPLLLDVREQYEWNQVRIPAASERAVVHIPMNEVPQRLAELAKEKEIVVFCAHGSRSYGVAAWLNEQGYSARNLAGGITQWAAQGGEVQTGKAAGGGSGAWQ